MYSVQKENTVPRSAFSVLRSCHASISSNFLVASILAFNAVLSTLNAERSSSQLALRASTILMRDALTAGSTPPTKPIMIEKTID